MTTPFIVYGQTALPANGSLTNPPVNVNGLNGEITSLPYVVPCGYNLILTGWGFEGLKAPFGVCVPWIGTAPATNAKCLASIGTGPGSYYVTNMYWSIPAEKILNVLLINGTTQANVVCAWFMQGYLEEVIA